MIAPRVDPIEGRASRRASKKRSSDAVAATQDPSRSRLDSGSTATLLDTGQRQEMIRKAAYFRAQQRGFASGQEMQDWLTAEQQVDDWLTGAVDAHGR